MDATAQKAIDAIDPVLSNLVLQLQTFERHWTWLTPP